MCQGIESKFFHQSLLLLSLIGQNQGKHTSAVFDCKKCSMALDPSGQYCWHAKYQVLN